MDCRRGDPGFPWHKLSRPFSSHPCAHDFRKPSEGDPRSSQDKSGTGKGAWYDEERLTIRARIHWYLPNDVGAVREPSLPRLNVIPRSCATRNTYDETL